MFTGLVPCAHLHLSFLQGLFYLIFWEQVLGGRLLNEGKSAQGDGRCVSYLRLLILALLLCFALRAKKRRHKKHLPSPKDDRDPPMGEDGRGNRL